MVHFDKVPRPSLNTVDSFPETYNNPKWPAGNCDSNKLFHFDWLYSRIRIRRNVWQISLNAIFGPFQCYIQLNCIIQPKFLILPCIWFSEFSSFFPSFLIPEYIQSNFAFALTIYSRSAWQRESRFRLWNTGLCFRGPSGLGTRSSCTKSSIQINYIILCRRMTKLGSLGSDDDNNNNNVKKQSVLWAKQLLRTCITLLASTVRLRRETSQCNLVWRTWTYYDKFSLRYLNMDKALDSTPGNVAYIWRIERFQIGAIKFERTQIHFFSDVFPAVVIVFA